MFWNPDVRGVRGGWLGWRGGQGLEEERLRWSGSHRV